MDLDWLQTFVMAAEEENFRKAAEKLHLAQPTVTLHIQKLEEHFGIHLFERRGRNVRLSTGGRRFLEHARLILSHVQTSQEDMVRWQQGYEESITIAVSPLVATTYLSQWVRGFSKEHRNVELTIKVKESTDILDSVLNQSCDIAFSRLSLHHPEIRCIELYADPVVFVVPSEPNPIEAAVRVADELIHQNTVFTHNHPEYWDTLVPKLRDLFPAIRTMHVSLVHVTTHLISEKLGVSFLPESTVRREILRGTIEEVPFPNLQLPIAHTYLLTGPRPTAASLAFMDYVTEYMKIRTTSDARPSRQ